LTAKAERFFLLLSFQWIIKVRGLIKLFSSGKYILEKLEGLVKKITFENQ